MIKTRYILPQSPTSPSVPMLSCRLFFVWAELEPAGFPGGPRPGGGEERPASPGQSTAAARQL